MMPIAHLIKALLVGSNIIIPTEKALNTVILYKLPYKYNLTKPHQFIIIGDDKGLIECNEYRVTYRLAL